MKYLVFIICFCLGSIINAQEVLCFNSEAEVKQYSEGTWKEKDVESNDYYRIHFKDGLGKFEKFDISDLTSNRDKNKYDLVFNEAIELSLDQMENCWQLGEEIKTHNGSELKQFQFLSEFEFVYNGRHFKKVRLLVNHNPYTCESGIEEAIEDANSGNFRLLTYGLIVFKDYEFTKFYWNYVKEKYGITLGVGGCIVNESIDCYQEKMSELIYKKFGKDVFEIAEKEARIAYNERKED